MHRFYRRLYGRVKLYDFANNSIPYMDGKSGTLACVVYGNSIGNQLQARFSLFLYSTVSIFFFLFRIFYCLISTYFLLENKPADVFAMVHLFGSAPAGPYVLPFQSSAEYGTELRIDKAIKIFRIEFGLPDLVILAFGLWDCKGMQQQHIILGLDVISRWKRHLIDRIRQVSFYLWCILVGVNNLLQYFRQTDERFGHAVPVAIRTSVINRRFGSFSVVVHNQIVHDLATHHSILLFDCNLDLWSSLDFDFEHSIEYPFRDDIHPKDHYLFGFAEKYFGYRYSSMIQQERCGLTESYLSRSRVSLGLEGSNTSKAECNVADNHTHSDNFADISQPIIISRFRKEATSVGIYASLVEEGRRGYYNVLSHNYKEAPYMKNAVNWNNYTVARTVSDSICLSSRQYFLFNPITQSKHLIEDNENFFVQVGGKFPIFHRSFLLFLLNTM